MNKIVSNVLFILAYLNEVFSKLFTPAKIKIYEYEALKILYLYLRGNVKCTLVRIMYK